MIMKNKGIKERKKLSGHDKTSLKSTRLVQGLAITPVETIYKRESRRGCCEQAHFFF